MGTLTGDIWPGLHDEIKKLRLKQEQSSSAEKLIRFNIANSIGSTQMPMKDVSICQAFSSKQKMIISAQIEFPSEKFPDQVMDMTVKTYEDTWHSDDASTEERADAAWFLAQYYLKMERTDGAIIKSREFCCQAGLLGNEHGQVNYLYRCLRDAVEVGVDQDIHFRWLVNSLTGDYIFKPLDMFPASSIHSASIQSNLRKGFEKFFQQVESRRELEILNEVFVRDVLGSTSPPHDRVFINDKWTTLTTAKMKSFESFRQGFKDMEGKMGEDVLHETAVFGTGEVIRDLVQTYNLDVDRKIRHRLHPGLSTALQSALVSCNMDTVSSLIDLGADVLPLFSEESLKLVVVQGNRELLHWLNHLIPLMRHRKNASDAKKRFDHIVLTQGLEQAVLTSNWSW
jgi:hypothetical protein